MRKVITGVISTLILFFLVLMTIALLLFFKHLQMQTKNVITQSRTVSDSDTLNPAESAQCNQDLQVYLFEYERDLWQDYTQTIRDAICDVDYFWSQVTEINLDYRMPDYVIQEYVDQPAHRPLEFTTIRCNNPSPSIPAFYCSSERGIILREPNHFMDYLAWDEISQGDLLITWTIAHEWGHHLQGTGLEQDDYSELQAECFAGAYFRYAIENPNLTHLNFTNRDWTIILRTIPVEGREDEFVGDTGNWSNITIPEQGNALRIGYDGGLTDCIAQLDNFLALEQ